MDKTSLGKQFKMVREAFKKRKIQGKLGTKRTFVGFLTLSVVLSGSTWIYFRADKSAREKNNNTCHLSIFKL